MLAGLVLASVLVAGCSRGSDDDVTATVASTVPESTSTTVAPESTDLTTTTTAPVATTAPDSVPATSEPSELEAATDAFSVVLTDSVSRSGPIETRCGVVAGALTGNDDFFLDEETDVVPGVTVHDLRWDGSSWIDAPIELVEPAPIDEYLPFAIANSTYLSVGPAAPDGLRLVVLDVWEDGPYGTVERLDDSCNWSKARVVFPCGTDTFLAGEFRLGSVVGGAPNEFVDDGSALVGSPLVNWSVEGDLPQPSCFDEGPHVLRWQSAIFAFQALPTTSACPGGYVPEGVAPIRMCEEGPLITDAQRYLSQTGFDVTVDGLFGPGTQRAVVALQQQVTALAVTGVLDADTLAYIGSGGGDD